ncbi:Six-hairpin glycosidase-like protein [Lasiodiplodia theobromae]|uniref:Unsaturated rhamnogalacturonyl hydrolase YteR n=1 Tax=Lasiodiplodia theobromae TaxID=45133 RepID=A0A5N5D7U2_9PEZI|nr:Unsaturated rhamnogalacturonyl hydrolase YteR [Lasiodiplodia theobromae]KAF9639851.1 Six-hairpin glycosidase-like protein [Lasiodiplodia theobromae]
MKSFILAATALASATLASAKVSLPNGWFKISPDDKIKHEEFHGKPRYLTWMADSQIKHGVEPTFAYTVSAYLSGVLRAYDRTGDEKYYDYVKRHADMVLYPAWNGDILLYNNSNSIDDIRFGHTFLDVYNLTGGEPIYKAAAQTLRDQISRTGRNPDGGFYHRYPVYIDQMWLDGIYMLDVFYARWTHEFEPDNTTAWDDIALQFDLIDAGTTVDRDRTNGLPLHGYDYAKTTVWADPDTGAAPHVWGRAVGWYIMALVDTLDYFPEKHEGRERLLGYLQSLADALVEAQDPEYKGWYNIMDPGLEKKSGNYIESSGSNMFVYGLLKALRLGYIEGDKYLNAALDGYELMTETFAEERKEDGTLDLEWTAQTGSLSSNGTFEYYASIPVYENDLKGVAPFLFASYEYELYLEGKN